MYIHLDLGWMAHPFPLGSFKIATQEQVETIRGLGLAQVRWVPQKSDPPFGAGMAAGEPDGPQTSDFAAPPPAVAGAHANAHLHADADADADAGNAPAAGRGADAGPGGAQHSDAAVGPSLTARAPGNGESIAAEAGERRQRREALAAQRQALHDCEHRFAEAAAGFRQAMDLVAAQPAQARAQTESLARSFIESMPGDHDVSIRLLNEAAGDKASSHALNVSIISLLMGRVFGLSDEDMLDMGVGALMHDVGKLQLPDRVRFRDDHLTPAEAQHYQSHVAHGVSCGRAMGLRPGALLVIAQHHEHADGTGFPLHLNSDRMTMAARIVALVNRYDNLCNPNVPSKALTPHEAVSLMFASGRNKFDTAIMGAFIKMMGVYPPGSAVQLTDDRYAVVTSVNSSRPLKPRVLVHDASVPREEALVVDLERHANLGIRRSLKPAQLPREALEYLSPRQRVVYFFETARELERCEVSA